jgi:hypothetical protein
VLESLVRAMAAIAKNSWLLVVPFRRRNLCFRILFF